MVEKDCCNSCLTAIRVLRASLVDELEGRIDSLLEVLVSREVFTRDDREEVLCQHFKGGGEDQRQSKGMQSKPQRCHVPFKIFGMM